MNLLKSHKRTTGVGVFSKSSRFRCVKLSLQRVFQRGAQAVSDRETIATSLVVRFHRPTQSVRCTQRCTQRTDEMGKVSIGVGSRAFLEPVPGHQINALLINRLVKRKQKAALERWSLFCFSDAASDTEGREALRLSGEPLRFTANHAPLGGRFAAAERVGATRGLKP